MHNFFSSEEKKERRGILNVLKNKYNFSSEEAVNHYLMNVFPNPEVLDHEEQKFYFNFKLALKILLEE